MKTAIILADGVKQILFTPENENEKQTLQLITPDDNIHTVIKKGTFSDMDSVFGAEVYECQGGYYRAKEQNESIMFVLTPKKPNN
jgi:hypothetical protein